MTGRLSFAELLDHHPGQSARDLARKALRQARELMGGDTGLLYLLRHEKDEDRLERAAAQPASEIGETSIAISHPSIVTRVAQTGETIKLNDARAPIAEARSTRASIPHWARKPARSSPSRCPTTRARSSGWSRSVTRPGRVVGSPTSI